MDFLLCVIGVIIALVVIGAIELALGFVAMNFGGAVAIVLEILIIALLWYLRVKE